MVDHGPHCETCSCGCTCGYGGRHEPENPNCELNVGASHPVGFNVNTAVRSPVGRYLVYYRGHDLEVSVEEYEELKRLAFDDPVAADSMARRLLFEQQRDD